MRSTVESYEMANCRDNSGGRVSSYNEKCSKIDRFDVAVKVKLATTVLPSLI